jgi:hypothetical protein
MLGVLQGISIGRLAQKAAVRNTNGKHNDAP